MRKILACIQTLKYDTISAADWYIPPYVVHAPVLEEGDIAEVTDVDDLMKDTRTFKNYQFLDTGNREHNTDLKKRYREVQIKINNVSKQQLRFYTDFYIDGGRRQSSYKYEIQHDIDPLSPNYGLIFVERVLNEDSASIGVAPGVTILAEDETQDMFWTLDNSMFPDINFWKIRIPVSGKGYTPRLIFVSANEAPYEILSNSWVFKQMYSR